MGDTYTINETVDVLGLNDVKADVTLGLPQPLKTENASSLDVKPLKADIGTDTHLAVDPLKADIGTNTHVAIDPLKTDSSLSVDLKPAVVDLCLTLNVGKLPNVCIRQPYRHHIGFTMYGVEVWGCTFSGEQETVIQEQHPPPRVALGPAAGGWIAPPRPDPGPPSRETGGLRIRLGP